MRATKESWDKDVEIRKAVAKTLKDLDIKTKKCEKLSRLSVLDKRYYERIEITWQRSKKIVSKKKYIPDFKLSVNGLLRRYDG